MSGQATKEFEVFKHELLLTPRQVRVRLLERMEELLLEITSGRTYPFDYIAYRVTDHRPESVTPVVLSAEDASGEIAAVLYEVGRSIPVAADSIAEPVRTVTELASRWYVSVATVMRWRREGLALRLFRFDGGRRKAGVRESLAAHFEVERSRLIRRALAQRRVSEPEKREIIEQALVGLARDLPPGRILASLSRDFSLRQAIVERHLLAAARENPVLAAFSRSGISRRESEEIFGAFQSGQSADGIAAAHDLSVETVERIILRARAKRLLRRPLKFIANDEFAAPGAGERILAAPEGAATVAVAPADELPVYLKGVAGTPLLSKDEEVALFRRYNYLKFAANELRRRLDARRPDRSLVERIEKLLSDANDARDHIVTSNLRLVPAIAKRHAAPRLNFAAIVSEGNMALIDAVESFDYARGNRFSTYAGWAITRRFARALPDERSRVTIIEDEVLDAAAKFEVDFTAPKPAAVSAGIAKALASLTERDRLVLERRFGIGKRDKPATLAELGALFGVTKERVRQIELQALARLRRIVERMSPELVPD